MLGLGVEGSGFRVRVWFGGLGFLWAGVRVEGSPSALTMINCQSGGTYQGAVYIGWGV